MIDACKWAIEHRYYGGEIGGFKRVYDQSQWDCGTSCCVWGAAHLIAGFGPTDDGPKHNQFDQKDPLVCLAVRIMNNSLAKPEHILAALNGECDDRGNWNCNNCTGCTDCNGCCNCTDCSVCTCCSGCSGCTYCTNCAGCSGCTESKGCTYCSGCTGSKGCTNCTNCANCTNCKGCTGCAGCAGCTYCTGKIQSNN